MRAARDRGLGVVHFRATISNEPVEGWNEEWKDDGRRRRHSGATKTWQPPELTCIRMKFASKKQHPRGTCYIWRMNSTRLLSPRGIGISGRRRAYSSRGRGDRTLDTLGKHSHGRAVVCFFPFNFVLRISTLSPELSRPNPRESELRLNPKLALVPPDLA